MAANKTSEIKLQVKRILSTQRDRISLMPVKGSSEGYNTYLAAGGVRFSGRPSHLADHALVEEAKRTPEPDWSRLPIDQLHAAEKAALHRISGGETRWRPILGRIRSAMSRLKHEQLQEERAGWSNDDLLD